MIETETALLPSAAGQHHAGLIAGLPCSQASLIADLCRDMFARRYGACDLIVLNELYPEAVERLSAASHSVLLLAEGADAALTQAVRDAMFPVVVLNQRFSEASRDYMQARGVSLQDTMRTMVRAQIGIEGLANIPRATVLEPRGDELVSAFAERIAAALALRADDVLPVTAERYLDRPLSAVLAEVCPHENPTLLEDDEEDALRRLEAFYGFHPEESGGVLDVPMASLLDGKPPHLPATNVIDLLGPPRCLTFGPYFHLPRGRWRARLTFLSLENMTTNTLGFEVAADNEIKVDQSFDIEASGKFAFECEFPIDDPYCFLEFRTSLRRGSIEGQFRPLSLTLKRSDCEHEADT